VIDALEVPGLVAEFLKAYKKAAGNPVEYTEVYNKALENYQAIEVHSLGLFPAKIIASRAPSESAEEFEYRKEAYQPITKSPWDRLLNTVGSVFHGVTLSVDDEQADEYIKKGYPGYPSLYSWFADVIGPVKCEQPMAVVATIVMNPPASDAEQAQPVAMLFQTQDVIYYESDNYFIGIISREVPVMFGRELEYSGLEIVLLDDVNEYRYIQIGKKVDYSFELIEHYQHDLGRLPAYELKGIPGYVGKKIFWYSPFENAIAYLNKAAAESSTLDAVIARSGFPIRAYYEEDCDAYGCEGGLVKGEGNESHSCQSCGGTGVKKGFSPFRDYTHNTKKAFQVQGNDPTFPGIAYVSPDSAPLEFLNKRIDNLIEKAGHAVNFDISRSSTTPETATKHRNDVAEQYKTLFKYATQVYDIIEWVTADILDIAFMRNEFNITLTRRSDFSIQSPEDLMAQLTQARASGLPGFVVNGIIESQVSLRSASDMRQQRLLEIAEYADPLHGYSTSDAIQVAGSAALPWQRFQHFQFASLVRQLEGETDGFLDLELAEIAARLEAKARLLQSSAPGNAQSLFGQIVPGT